MTVLFDSPYVRLEVDPASRIVRQTRSAVRFPSLEEATAALEAVGRAAAPLDRARHGLLIDLRQVTGRNDEPFEAVLASFRKALFEGFARRAVLVRTLAGKLQLQRISRQPGAPRMEVFQDEAEALAYLVK